MAGGYTGTLVLYSSTSKQTDDKRARPMTPTAAALATAGADAAMCTMLLMRPPPPPPRTASEAMPGFRGLHSSTSQLNVSAFGGTRGS